MEPLNDDEAALLYVTGMGGSACYPINKLMRGAGWTVGPWRSWKGFPTVFKTKKAAHAMFERWAAGARERFAEMRRADPNVILTAVGVSSNG